MTPHGLDGVFKWAGRASGTLLVTKGWVQKMGLRGFADGLVGVG